MKMLIQGNADERGSREYNLALGQKRAEAVRKALALLGAREDQLEAVSLGEEKPACTESTAKTAGQEPPRRHALLGRVLNMRMAARCRPRCCWPRHWFLPAGRRCSTTRRPASGSSTAKGEVAELAKRADTINPQPDRLRQPGRGDQGRHRQTARPDRSPDLRARSHAEAAEGLLRRPRQPPAQAGAAPAEAKAGRQG
jgi:hypothetical protein